FARNSCFWGPQDAQSPSRRHLEIKLSHSFAIVLDCLVSLGILYLVMQGIPTGARHGIPSGPRSRQHRTSHPQTSPRATPIRIRDREARQRADERRASVEGGNALPCVA